MTRRKTLLPLFTLVAVLAIVSGCGADPAPEAGAAEPPPAAENTDATNSSGAAGIRLVSAAEGAAIQAQASDDLVVLDVRTPEEFAEGHLDGAIMIDFYRPDFADQLAGLDPDAPYLLYCRSGNRSGQAAAIMNELGFTDVADIDGGILAWNEASLPTVTG